MKKHFIYLCFIMLALSSCKKEEKVTEKPTTTQVTDAQLFTLDKENSNIDWKGYKVFKSESTSHFGEMKFVDGEVGIKDGKLVSGKFTADVKSLKTTDIEDTEQAKKLDEHLKNVDFFEVEKFPTAIFEITNVTTTEQGDYNTILEGNLTIKDVTKPVKFNANVKTDNQQVSIYTEPTDIDRTEFNVKFQSPVENGILKNEITLQISVKASKK